MPMRRFRCLLVILGLGLVAGGCGDDDPAVPTLPDGAANPQELMHNFLTVYENLDAANHALLIAPDFRVYLQPGTVFEFDLPRPFLDHDEEVASAARMFSGEASTLPDGRIVPGITRLQFTYFEAQAAWETAPPESPFPGALRAPYLVQMVADQGSQARLLVEGLITFYLTSESVESGGRTRTVWTMIGQEDATLQPAAVKRAAENITWGGLKALYR